MMIQLKPSIRSLYPKLANSNNTIHHAYKKKKYLKVTQSTQNLHVKKKIYERETGDGNFSKTGNEKKSF